MIFVIHSSKRTDRFSILVRELSSQGLHNKVDIIEADTSTLNPVSNISRAHKKCVRAAMEAGEKRVIILEDDVRFLCPQSFARFISLSEQLPDDWDLFLSGAYDAQMEEYSDGIRKVKKFSGLHCYMVNSRYYRAFLSANENINLDKWMSTPTHSTSNAYVAYPMLVMQHDGFSDNVKKVTEYNKSVARKHKLWDCSNP